MKRLLKLLTAGSTALVFTLLSACGAGSSPTPNEEPSQTATKVEVLAVRMADSIMERRPNGWGDWDYQTGTVLSGFEELYKATGDKRYYEYIKLTVDRVIKNDGTISNYRESEYNIDEIKEGTALLFLYNQTKDARYKTAAQALRQQLTNHPRTKSGGFWHKNKYPNQMWLDGLYMAEPFYAHYGAIFEEPANFDDVVHQLTLMEKVSLDDDTGLLYHGWDESKNQNWANPTTGRSPEFWGRSLGWYVMALVDVLDYIPPEYADQRATIIAILQRRVTALERYQDEDGVWWQITDKTDRIDNWQESSATAMYVYAIAKGVHKGYLDQAHAITAQKGWNGLNTQFVNENPDGTVSLTGTCVGTSVGSYSYYVRRGRSTNDSKGLGPYLMAGAAISMLSN